MLPIGLDRNSAVTLQEQIFSAVRDLVRAAHLPAGARLASSRELARALGVSRNTAVLAYDRLAAEGYVELRPGAGVFVAQTVLDRAPLPPDPPAPVDARPAPSEAGAAPALLTREDQRPVLDLWYGHNDPGLFPAKVWRSLGATVLEACAVGLTTYGPVGGEPRLRQAIADHLATTRGLVVEAEQVIITSGAQEALNLIARLLLRPGDGVVVEEPGYAAAARVFEAQGAHLSGAPVDAEGLDPAGLDTLAPRLVYVTPAHQFPTGVVLSAARRRALIAACARIGAFIVEDDYEGEIVFDRPPVAALATMDRCQRTLYVGSFSRTIGSGLRLGYMVVPRTLVGAAEAAKGLMSYGQSWLDQQILAAFLETGRYRRHLNRLRTAYRPRRDVALAGLHHLFGPKVAVSGGEGGLHLYCVLPPHGPDAATVAERARGVGVGLYPAAACAVRGAPERLTHSLLVGFAGLDGARLATAFARLERALGGARPRAAPASPHERRALARRR